MFDQKLLFKTMLWSLGLAAFLGVVAVLIADFDVVGRITATAFLTSAAAAFLWQAAARLERNELSIWTAQIGSLLFYVCALCGIWEIGDAGKMWGTGFICLGCSAVAAGGWALRLKEGYRHTGMTTAIVAIVSAACWLWAIWIGTDDVKMLMTGFSVAGWGAAAAVCLVGLERLPHRHWRWIGVTAATAGFLLTEYHILADISGVWGGKALIVLASITIVVIHALLCYSPSAPKELTIRVVAVAATIATALLIDIIAIQEIEGDLLIVRLVVAAAIVASTSTIATAFIIQSHWRQSRQSSGIRETSDAMTMPREQTDQAAEFKTVRLECPQCRRTSEMSVGASRCPECGLRFKIEVYTPKAPSRLDGWMPE